MTCHHPPSSNSNIESFQGYINVDTLPKSWKNSEIYKNDETLPKNWKSYHKMKIIPVDFRQFPPIFRRPQRQNKSFGRILQKTNILDLNLASIHKKSRACSPNGSGDMTISAGNNFYTIKLRSTHNKEQFETNEVSIY